MLILLRGQCDFLRSYILHKPKQFLAWADAMRKPSGRRGRSPHPRQSLSSRRRRALASLRASPLLPPGGPTGAAERPAPRSRQAPPPLQDAYWKDAGEGAKSKAGKKKDDDEARRRAAAPPPPAAGRPRRSGADRPLFIFPPPHAASSQCGRSVRRAIPLSGAAVRSG